MKTIRSMRSRALDGADLREVLGASVAAANDGTPRALNEVGSQVVFGFTLLHAGDPDLFIDLNSVMEIAAFKPFARAIHYVSPVSDCDHDTTLVAKVALCNLEAFFDIVETYEGVVVRFDEACLIGTDGVELPVLAGVRNAPTIKTVKSTGPKSMVQRFWDRLTRG